MYGIEKLANYASKQGLMTVNLNSEVAVSSLKAGSSELSIGILIVLVITTVNS